MKSWNFNLFFFLPKDTFTTSNPSHFDCDDLIVDNCPREVFHEIVTIKNIENATMCMTFCEHTINYPSCKSFFYDSIDGHCILYDIRIRQYVDLCETLGAGTDTVEHCLKNDESYPNICKVSFNAAFQLLFPYFFPLVHVDLLQCMLFWFRTF